MEPPAVRGSWKRGGPIGAQRCALRPSAGTRVARNLATSCGGQRLLAPFRWLLLRFARKLRAPPGRRLAHRPPPAAGLDAAFASSALDAAWRTR